MSRAVFYEPATLHPHIFKRFRLPRLGPIILRTMLKRAGYEVKVFVETDKTAARASGEDG